MTLLQSKTFWLAVVQAIGGGLIIYFTQMNEAGVVVILKSVLDISLRLITETRIEKVI